MNFADSALKEIQEREQRLKNMKQNLTSSVDVSVYLAELLWNSYVKCEIRRLIKIGRKDPSIIFKPFVVMQDCMMVRNDPIFQLVFLGSMNTTEIAHELVSIAISEGMNAQTYEKTRHSESDHSSPFRETYVEVSLPTPKL